MDPQSPGVFTLARREQARLDNEFWSATQLETLTGTKASTWRYWASIGQGPPSFKLGRRRVWKRSTVMAWLASQESVTA
jgi:prophage regulatory protein